jgi:hypothetical protein
MIDVALQDYNLIKEQVRELKIEVDVAIEVKTPGCNEDFEKELGL